MTSIPQKKFRVLGYVRVSSEEQKKGQSPEAQKDYIRYWCEKNGWELVGIEDRDVGMPAEFLDDMGKRVGLQRILDDPPGGYDAIVAWHNDRLSRDLHQLMEIERRLKRKGVRLLFRNLEGVDINTSYGRAMLQMSGMYAELEKRVISDRVSLGKQRAKKIGRHQGKPFTGFVHNENGQPVPVDPQLVEKVKQMKADGVKPYLMAQILGIPKSPMYRILAHLGLWKVKSREKSSVLGESARR